MTEREGSAHGAAARELLIDRQLPRFGEPGHGTGGHRSFPRS